MTSGNHQTAAAEASTGTARQPQQPAVTSANRAWAVGDGGGIAVWNGTRWKLQQPAGVTGPAAQLIAVAASSSRTAWAIGEHGRTSEQRPLIVGWNGRAWKQVASPNPGGQTVLFAGAIS